MRKLISIAALALLGACSTLGTINQAANSTVSQDTINKARTAVLGIENVYGIAIIAADDWAKLPKCGTPKAGPVCPTNAGIVTVNKAAIAAKTVLVEAERVVLSASPTQSSQSLAVSSAQNAWNAYQGVLAAYGIQTGSTP